jgi:hypothetical protein
MGDFERTFGAGADVDAIIDGFSAAAARESEREEEVLESGRDLPRARSFFELTGQHWHPARIPAPGSRPSASQGSTSWPGMPARCWRTAPLG